MELRLVVSADRTTEAGSEKTTSGAHSYRKGFNKVQHLMVGLVNPSDERQTLAGSSFKRPHWAGHNKRQL